MRKADNLPPSCAVVTKSGSLNFLEPSGPVMGLLYLFFTAAWAPVCTVQTVTQDTQRFQSSAALRLVDY